MHNNSEINCNAFCGTNGEAEHFIFIKVLERASSEDQMKVVRECYASVTTPQSFTEKRGDAGRDLI